MIIFITLTNVVLLHPGGPYKRIPFGGFNPSFLNVLLYCNGHSIACFNCYKLNKLLEI